MLTLIINRLERATPEQLRYVLIMLDNMIG